MRQSLKISLSLLIALALFAAFSVLAFRGLFDYVQVAFFQPRVLRERAETLATVAGVVERYHRRNVERFAAVLQEPFLAGVFSSTGQQSREDIFNRTNLFGRLLEEYPNLLGVRFLDPDGEKVHFSTFRQDVSLGTDKRTVTYLDFSRSEPSLRGAELLARAGQEPRLAIDGGGGRLIYPLPVSDGRGEYRGTALFFLSAGDLEAALAREPGLEVRELMLVDRLGVLINFPAAERELVAPRVASSWTGRPRPADSQDTLEFEGPTGKSRHLLLSRQAGEFGLVGWLVPYSSIELQPLLKAILLAAVLLTVFLLVFLIFNIRQDPQVLLTRRIKRFQLEVLAELIEGKERVDWKRWRDELAGGRAQLRSRIKRGVGRIPQGKEAELDGLIDRGWDEIIAIIEARLGEQPREKVDISQIEEMIQKALDRGRFTMAGTLPVSTGTAASVEARPPVVSSRRDRLVVEEISVEEVSELGEAAREPPPAAVEELAAEEEAEAVEEIEQTPATAVAVEALAAEEEAEAVEEIEAVEEAEAVEEIEAVEEVGQTPATAAAVEEIEVVGRKPATAAEVEPVLEELTPVGEIIALPLEPQEKLEELPPVEEPVRVEPAARKQAEPVQAPEALETLEGLEEAGEEEAGEEAPETELESAEAEPGAIRELLESPVELEMEEPTAARLSGEEAAQLDQLAAQGVLRTFSIVEIEAQILEQRTSVVMENGVYRIKEEVRLGRERGAAKEGRGLKALAEAVLSTGEDEESGIGALLGTGFGVDLSAELGSPAARGERVSYSDLRRANRIRFSDGLDYDQYLQQFRDGASETGSMKSLVEISRKIKAVNAALLVKAGDAYVTKLRIGLLDKPERILFSAGDPFYDRFLSRRQAVLLSERPESIPSLAARFNPEDLKYMKAALFLPAVYQKTQAVLFLGLPSKKSMELKDIINKLEIYL